MTQKTWCVLMVAISLVGACGDKSSSNQGGAGTGAAGSGGPDDTSHLPCDYEDETVNLKKDLVIPKGETVHVCPGVTFKAATDVKIQVRGELLVDGSKKAPVSFLGTAKEPRSWHGIVVEAGGHIKLAHAKVGGAVYGLFTNPDSSFVIDRSTFDTSFKSAILQSEGAVTNSIFLASPPPNIAISEGVSIDDPNGTVTIIDASPSFENCKFEGASAYTDLVRVGGESAATFDRVHLHAAHCGFHTSGAKNSSIHVTNAIIDTMAYGIMAYATKPIIENSVFTLNGNDVGLCNGATADNTPVLENNHYSDGSLAVDASCFRIGTTDQKPADEPNPEAGVTGL